MSSKTKILLLKKRECIYTLILAAFGITLVVLMLLMFLPGSGAAPASSKNVYTPGLYTTSITLGDTSMELEVRVNRDKINSIQMVPLSETVSAMYPLVQPSLDQLAAQICASQTTGEIYYENSRQYTSLMLLQAIRRTLQRAAA